MRPRLLIVAAVVATVLGIGLFVERTVHGGDDSRTGTGLTYGGRFYWASGAEVSSSALEGDVAHDVRFQDTTADLRRVHGLDPAETMAALLPSLNGSPGGLRWTLVSTDQGRGTDPFAYADTRAVLVATG